MSKMARGSSRGKYIRLVDMAADGESQRDVETVLHWRRTSIFMELLPQRFPTSPLRSLSAEQPLLLPAVQHDFGSSHVDSTEIRRRQDAVRSVFLKSWRSYKSRAWLHDELKPVTGGARDTFGGWAATLVDALDTLWIMDLRDDFYEAAAAAVSLDFANSTAAGVNLFETTIRHLGGLLSAYDLGGEEALLRKATELGEMLYHAFDTPNRMPPFWFDFEAAKAGQLLADTSVGSATPASLALEFTRLSQLTGDAKFFDAISGVTDFLETTQNTSLLPGMWPKRLILRDKTLPDNLFTLGGQADSLYEYLPKMHALLGGSEPRYAALYGTAMDTALKHLAFRPMVPDAGNTSRSILFTGNVSLENGTNALIPSYQHLSCFVGGMFGLAGKLLQLPYHVSIGEQITEGCVWAYNGTPTGIMPEVFSLIPCPEVDDSCQWNETRWQREGADERFAKGYASVKDSRYILRPEAIESVFVSYRITGDERWRDEAWIMFQSIMVATETEYGNSAIEDVVMEGEAKKKDEMESFWAETLKYFYLIFSPPDLFSLDEYVFNTEAHPLRRPKPTA